MLLTCLNTLHIVCVKSLTQCLTQSTQGFNYSPTVLLNMANTKKEIFLDNISHGDCFLLWFPAACIMHILHLIVIIYDLKTGIVLHTSSRIPCTTCLSLADCRSPLCISWLSALLILWFLHVQQPKVHSTTTYWEKGSRAVGRSEPVTKNHRASFHSSCSAISSTSASILVWNRIWGACLSSHTTSGKPFSYHLWSAKATQEGRTGGWFNGAIFLWNAIIYHQNISLNQKPQWLK